MKMVYRQDGSAVDLSEDDADQWIKRGLATPSPIAVTTKPATPLPKAEPIEEGVSA